MRQAGILAAAGLISLEQMPARLHEDHANARLLAESLGAPVPQTNIVIYETGGDAAAFSRRLKENGILANAVSPTAIRFVTHFDVTSDMCKHVAETCSPLISLAARH
jgi:threonine aldolase